MTGKDRLNFNQKVLVIDRKRRGFILGRTPGQEPGQDYYKIKLSDGKIIEERRDNLIKL